MMDKKDNHFQNLGLKNFGRDLGLRLIALRN